MKRISLALMFLPAALTSLAVPALRRPVTLTQPDGTPITVLRIGDERSHLLMTTDSLLLVHDNHGYCYATADSRGVLQSTGIRAVDASLRSGSSPAFAARFTPELAARRTKARREAPANALPGLIPDCKYPVTGDVRALVILVEYADIPFSVSDPNSYFTDLLNGDNFTQYGSTGSARQYFEDASCGQFHPHFDVVGPVKLPEPQSYYGRNLGPDESDMSAYMMLVHAARLVDNSVNFADYDMDGDGAVDNVYIFYAGQGENSYGTADCVWPHAWELNAKNAEFILDGVLIDRYACSNEWMVDRPEGIGTFTHEYSHVMGLPDLYDTSWGLEATPQNWDLMDHGSYNNEGRTPPTYSIFERAAMGWLQPEAVTEAANCSLRPIIESNAGYMVPTSRDNEYFLFENRQLSGWDAYLPNFGMLIWHIDYEPGCWANNVVNNTSSHLRVEIEKANNERDGYDDEKLAGWSYPGTSGATAFSANTLPSMLTWRGEDLRLPIADITQHDDGTVTFTVAGGRDRMPVPQAVKLEKTGPSSFVVSWEEVPEATDYFLHVSSLGEGEDVTAEADMGSGKFLCLPEGWESSSSSKYSSEGNFGIASPSLKLGTDGDYLMSPLFDCDVRSIRLWHKGQQIEGSSLEILGLIDDEWKSIGFADIKKGQPGIDVIENLPSGIRQVKFLFNRTSGYVAIDDVIITAGPDEYVMPGYEALSTSGALSATVTLPDEGKTARYRCRISATDGTYTSRLSAPVTIDMASNSINTVHTSSQLRLSGHMVETTDVSYIEAIDMLGRIVGAGYGTLTLPASGIYIIRTDNGKFKVIAH